LDSNEPGLFAPSHSVSKTSSAKPSSESTGPKSPSMTTLEPSRQMNLGESISYVEEFLASPGVSPGSSEAQKMTAISGRRWLPLLKSYGLNLSLAKMCEALLTSHWASSAAFLTWKASGIKPSHLLFQLAPSMPRTEEIGSGLWPTAQAWDGKRGPRKPDGKRGMALSDLAAPQMWPTPHANCHTGAGSHGDGGDNIQTAVRMWPTPTASDYKGSGPTVIRRDGKNRLNDRLDYTTEQRAQNGGQLNPTWVEWLMGFPTGWTDLKPSEMPSSPRSPSKSDGQ